MAYYLSPNFQQATPNKLFEAMAAGVPVVACWESQEDRLLQLYQRLLAVARSRVPGTFRRDLS